MNSHLIEMARTIILSRRSYADYVQNTQGIDGVSLEEIKKVFKETLDMMISDNSGDHAALWRVKYQLNRFPVERLCNENIELYLYENFLTQKECDAVLEELDGQFHQSNVVNRSKAGDDYRQSVSCNMNNIQSNFLRRLDQRIATVLGIHWSYAENAQAQRYYEGDYYKSHVDYFGKYGRTSDVYARTGQRTFTFMIYVEAPDGGGETMFPKLGFGVRPRAGTAVIWNNLTTSGEGNEQTVHEALPVSQGRKTVITKWFGSRSWLPDYDVDLV